MGTMDAVVSKRDTGHSFNLNPTLNAAGLVYTTFITAYTGFLIFFICLLWAYRRHPAVHIRGFFLTAATLIIIHVYVAALFIVYPLNGWYKCGTEFWYMSIIFPLGIALFQSANAKLMAVAREQQHLAETNSCWAEKKESFKWSIQGLRFWYRDIDCATKTYLAIGGGLVVQLVLTFVLFFGSRRFSPSTGFFGDHVSATECRRGAEWIPSVVWQFLWTWIIGPMILYKTRHIKDTHNWALQTRLTVIAGLPGTPLWLAFLYATGPKIDNFNMWWPPAMWYAPGLITMQVTTLAIPFYDIWRHRGYGRPLSRQSSANSSNARFSTENGRKSRDNWDAFEFQLKDNIQRLVYFAAKKDFTAENILFLKEVRDFKRKWRRNLADPPKGGIVLTAEEQRDMFEDAARIYYEFICPETSRCAVNLDSKTTGALKEVFANVTLEMPVHIKSPRRSDPPTAVSRHEVAPWESPVLQPISRPESRHSERGSHAALIHGTDVQSLISEDPSFSLASPTTMEPATIRTGDDIDAIESVTSPISITISNAPLLQLQASERGRIIQKNSSNSQNGSLIVPSTFSLRVFDKAEDSIKYLVYTNTWKSYAVAVDTGYFEPIDRTESHRVSDSGVGNSPVTNEPHLHDVEMYHIDYDTQDKSSVTSEGLHHGVLDEARGPLPYGQVDSRCVCCRRKEENAKAAGRNYVKRGGLW